MNPARYLFNVLKWLDVGLNVVMLFSVRVETLSRRAGLARRQGKRWGCVLCAILNPAARLLVGQEDHCESAVESGCIR